MHSSPTQSCVTTQFVHCCINIDTVYLFPHNSSNIYPLGKHHHTRILNPFFISIRCTVIAMLQRVVFCVRCVRQTICRIDKTHMSKICENCMALLATAVIDWQGDRKCNHMFSRLIFGICVWTYMWM